MSRIYLHSPSGVAEISGAERAHMGWVVNGMTKVAAGPLFDHDGDCWVRRVLPPGHYTAAYRGREFIDAVSTWLALAHDDYHLPDGRQVPQFDVALNTALAMGSNAVRLLARLHAQCEIHCWVDGPNRAWLAGKMDAGRASGVCRPDQGWEAAAALLRARDDEPVVFSYSVTDQFPNRHVAGWRDENDGDDWYDLPEPRRWELAMAGLRERTGMEMTPGGWDDYHFGAGDTVLDLEQAARSAASVGTAALRAAAGGTGGDDDGRAEA